MFLASEDDGGLEAERAKYYRRSVVSLAQALITAISTSQATQNLPSGDTGKKYWASVLFARLCGIGGSLQKILPGSPSNMSGAVWDSTSALSLCRAMFEADLALFYLCLDELSDEDYSLRLWLVFLHDCLERPRIMDKITGDTPDAEHVTFYAAEAARLRGKIASNAIFQALPEWKRKRLLEGKTPYYLSQDELLERQGNDARKLRGIWEFLSSHVHSYPFSFYRTTEVADRGSGRENRVDKSYCGLAAEYAAVMLSQSSERMAALFPEVPEIPRCLIEWDTLTCRAVKDDSSFVLAMSSPAAFEVNRSAYGRVARGSVKGKPTPPEPAG
jgi:hypothetical protein